MSDGWSVTDKVCGNCQFWQLSGYGQREWLEGSYGRYTSPTGSGGNHCDGGYSTCRRHAPTQAAPKNGGVTAHAIWPETAREDWCGDFQQRHGYGSVTPKTQQQETE